MDEIDRPADRGSKQPAGNVRGRPELEFPGRRSFIAMLIAAGGVFVGVLLAVPLVEFAADPLFHKTSEEEWSEAGALSEFAGITQPAEPIIKVQRRDGWRLELTQRPIFVLPPNVSPHQTLSPVCPHLGCQVEWEGDNKRFYCPCHGSVFAENGSVISGPAPRPLDYLDSKVEQGRLMVKYQYFRLLVPDREVIG